MNERQKLFADEYLISGIAYNAALKAGYSEKYAKTNSHKLLENTRIKAYIEERMKELEKKKNQDGYMTKPYSQSLIFKSEPHGRSYRA